MEHSGSWGIYKFQCLKDLDLLIKDILIEYSVNDIFPNLKKAKFGHSRESKIKVVIILYQLSKIVNESNVLNPKVVLLI